MGADNSKYADGEGGQVAYIAQRTQVGRAKAITANKVLGGATKLDIKLPPKASRADATDYEFIKSSLVNLLLFSRLDRITANRIVAEMYALPVQAGEILIQQGDSGDAATKLFVVRSGKFEVLERRKDVMFKVNTKERGDVFGEISLMYDCPRSATVAATTDASVWVLERDVFRHFVQASVEDEKGQIQLFLNSVPLLSSLRPDEKMLLVDAFQEEAFVAGARVIMEGDVGDKFYIIKEGEAQVIQGDREVNRLFRSDFFGEQALLQDEPRKATVRALTPLVCLTLDRRTFVAVLGPLQDIMAKEKSPEVVNQRMAKLKPQGSAAHRRPVAEVIIKYDAARRSIVCDGHLDEVVELRRGGQKMAAELRDAERKLVLVEGELLGEGAFSRVCKVTEETTGRVFALKRMAKSAALQCPEHVFCEQHITRNIAHPFCLRQYASFQDKANLYMLFDLMPGGDLMDVLVAEAKVIKYPVADKNSLRKGCLAPKMKMWQGMEEPMSKFYIASIVLALEYLHDNSIAFRDLKPENVLIDGQGYVKLGDFGFAKQVDLGGRTYTFCGTPGYVAPENVMGRGYNHSVDWWTLGVLMYVLLTARQPFTSPKTQDPMEVMRRIVDDRWPIKYPPYMSDEARDLISHLLERKPVKRIGMLQGKARDIKMHPWFAGFDWDALAARRMDPPRKPKEADSAKRKTELAEAHRAEPRELQTISPQEAAEWDRVFKDF
ncbi:hypothetical protein CHLRE_12g493250v5 [Chlamydomonas reinhardtii]|uniref:cGMP-dependent protein kinase n=1 Tax=Chlamydomonas reinhardtii TaxID=3055 RepID=A8JDQ7_CHLRE|nr:uncharacterized protein CHLRE_12g493250v5 [Chlamydomonas reinhardtii]PNW74512.1 hypothetical protein CHLRE_12g493250v5 [Chlamydomonas reinhardtii]|eukprot:XP_001700571.1 predicted protein [Chlamydomonas reinhardtii]